MAPRPGRARNGPGIPGNRGKLRANGRKARNGAGFRVASVQGWAGERSGKDWGISLTLSLLPTLPARLRPSPWCVCRRLRSRAKVSPLRPPSPERMPWRRGARRWSRHLGCWPAGGRAWCTQGRTHRRSSAPAAPSPRLIPEGEHRAPSPAGAAFYRGAHAGGAMRRSNRRGPILARRPDMVAA
jgi:hypothetical protein